MKLMLHIPAYEANYTTFISLLTRGHEIKVTKGKVDSIESLIYKAKSLGVEGIMTTDPKIVELLLPDHPGPTIDEQQGSFFLGYELPILVQLPLSQLAKVRYGKFLFSRYLTKLTNPGKWLKPTQFTYEVLEEDEDLARAQEELSNASFIVIDIETPLHPTNLIIGEYGVTGIFWNAKSKKFFTRTYVVPINRMAHVYFMRAVNANPVPKLGQNFKYDLAFMHLWNCPVNNWRFDTVTLMHSYLSELPKDLGFLTNFSVRESFNWKYKSKLGGPEALRYNAYDTWGTANAFLALIAEYPDWAVKNFHMEFPVNFPAFLMESQGIKVHDENFQKALAEREEASDQLLASMRTMVANSAFNPASPVQVKTLLSLLGFRDIESADDKVLSKLRLKSALAARIIRTIQDYRGAKKAISSYLNPDAAWRGRLYFSFNPHGTDTGRPSAKKHQFSFNGRTKTGAVSTQRVNIGLAMQTIPRGDDDKSMGFKLGVKHIMCADDGWVMGEADYSQAEARDVAYISGDENLIRAVDCGKDFHSLNASAFFGVPYHEIYDDEVGEAINKALRNLAKRVNHGANYNMGPGVLIETMGEDKVAEAGRLLGLPFTDLFKIAEYLLETYTKSYPDVKGRWYNKIKYDVKQTGLLTNPLGWTRRCFGDPSSNKPDLNGYVAHVPQSTNAMTLNKAGMRCFYYALKNADTFRLSVLIHDSVVFQAKKGYEDTHRQAVMDMMRIPVDVIGSDGKTRTLIVPSDCGKLKEIWGECK